MKKIFLFFLVIYLSHFSFSQNENINKAFSPQLLNIIDSFIEKNIHTNECEDSIFIIVSFINYLEDSTFKIRFNYTGHGIQFIYDSIMETRDVKRIHYNNYSIVIDDYFCSNGYGLYNPHFFKEYSVLENFNISLECVKELNLVRWNCKKEEDYIRIIDSLTIPYAPDLYLPKSLIKSGVCQDSLFNK